MFERVVDSVGGRGYNFAQTFDRTTVRPDARNRPYEESAMSTATMTRPSTLASGYAGFAEPVRAVRPLAAPGPLALERRLPARPQPSRPPASRPRTRLTRRGRLVLLVLAVGLL